MKLLNHLSMAGGLLCAATAFPTVSLAAPISGQGTWEVTLHGRDLDGNSATFEAYYDSSLNITWLADANFAMTSGYDADGKLLWSDAMSWAANLNPYGSGITGWRLPNWVNIGSAGCTGTYPNGTDCYYNVDPTSSEMAHMYYTTLGDLAYFSPSGAAPQPGWGLVNTGPFTNIRRDAAYWTNETYYFDYPNRAYTFWFDDGYLVGGSKTIARYAWAVHDGDIAAQTVPVPAAAWLLGGGLVGLIGVLRRRR